MLTAEIMDLLDSTIVNVAGPSLKRDLGVSAQELQWIIGGYALALGAFLILGGRLGDRFGRRQMFLFGVITFTISSLLCAVAPTTGWLILFRLVEGVAAAMLLPQGFGLIRQAFPPAEFGKAFAVFGPVFGLGGILGPIIGGFIIQANLFNIGWRMVFVVNIPIGIVATALAFVMLPRQPGDRSVSIDPLGVALVATAAALLVLPLIQGQQAGWPLWTWLCFLGSALGFGIFVLQNRAIAAKGKTPLVDPEIFSYSSYTTGLGGLFLFFSGFTGVYLVVTLFLIGLRDVAHFHLFQIIPGMVISGFGTGLVVAALFDTIISAIAGSAVGSASGVLSAVQSIASSVGVAVFGTAFFAGVTDHNSAVLGFRNSLYIQIAFVAVFVGLTFLLPKGQKQNAWEDNVEGLPVT